MTEAAVRITQSTVEQFTEQYLASLGATIEKGGTRWEVTVPAHAPTALPNGPFVLICEDPSSDLNENERLLHPESAVFQELLAEASERQPTGKIVLTAADTQVDIPPWLQAGSVDVVDTSFTPYYDRSAVAILYRISIETVSEYQTELLHTIAVDIRSLERLPGLEQTFLEATAPTGAPVESHPIEIGSSKAEELIAHTRELAVEHVQPTVDELHQEASRAADAEVEEYRQLQQQRIAELEEKQTKLTTRIDELSESIRQSSTQGTRVEALQERKELKAEYEDLNSELDDLRHRREHGFPEKQAAIRDRHALDVVVTPLTMTQIEYERGELTAKLTEGSITRSLTLGYGTGVGVTEQVSCASCGQPLGDDTPLRSLSGGLQCSQCYRN